MSQELVNAEQSLLSYPTDAELLERMGDNHEQRGRLLDFFCRTPREAVATDAVTYCSFAGPERSFGIVILHGVLDAVRASLICHSLRVNPGGELITVPITKAEFLSADSGTEAQWDAMWNNRNRIVPPEEARALFDAKPMREFEEPPVLVHG